VPFICWRWIKCDSRTSRQSIFKV